VIQHHRHRLLTLFRWQRQLEPVIRRNKPAAKIDMGALSQHVMDYPDAFLYERTEAFNVTLQVIYYALKRLDISYKKLCNILRLTTYYALHFNKK
jgi:hypothetical protein